MLTAEDRALLVVRFFVLRIKIISPNVFSSISCQYLSYSKPFSFHQWFHFGSPCTKSNSEQADNEFDEDKKGQDACRAFKGKSNPSKTVCCHSKCPICGGKGCGKQKDAFGSKLGKNKCCVNEIKSKGKTCGSLGRKAPCTLP